MEKNNRMFMDYVLLYTSDPSDPPPLWPICIGHENNRSHSAYNWDNSVRKLDFPTRTVQYTISGKGAFTDSMGKEHTVGADDILFLMEPSPQRYSLPADSDFWEVLFISFRGELAFQLFEQLTKQYGELVHFDENNEFLKTLQEFRLVAKESERMHSDAYFASGFAYSFFMTLFSELQKTVRNTCHSFPPLTKAIFFCNRHISSGINVEDMARSVGMSRSHFSRTFRKLQGISPAQYLFNLRMTHAKILLETKMPLKEISHACGFENLSHFCKKFKEKFGESPGTYRKRNFLR